MVSFGFNTLIGQITPIALANIGWKFYIVFIIFDVTNALFFYLFLPETKGVTLEAMNDLFTNSPLLVVGSKWKPGPGVDVDRLARKMDGTMVEIENVDVKAVSDKVEV